MDDPKQSETHMTLKAFVNLLIISSHEIVMRLNVKNEYERRKLCFFHLKNIILLRYRRPSFVIDFYLINRLLTLIGK